MGKKAYWIIIFTTLILNVVMLQLTTRAYLGREFEIVPIYSGVAFVSAIVTIITFLQWRKAEYGDKKSSS
ncbi:hypothetical protein [Texcoconibacillus texcoconensis]|uniref:Uncharacterized protein n=1 Tax=Texcoconibacillus texcoconensis TaxID=1095777 RepID=A0A840QU79_9BACI|nr:hypothetical protein [Texcoconibacillus texcoconensis]MBB5174817.1 hypothetical protein [Texcoconibacillus texcoconensis]